MTQTPFLIHVVDDDPAARMVAADALNSPEFAVREFPDARSMFAAIDKETPNLILLDIEMPEMNGIAACRALRGGGHTKTKVMFISAHNDLETRLIAYEAGGDDFIVKPYEPAELARKSRVAMRESQQHHALSSQADEAQRTAFTAMTSMAEIGVVLSYFRAFFSCDTPEALIGKLIEALGQFGLEGMAQLRTGVAHITRSSHGDCSPLECSILEHASGMEHIFQFRDRLAVNYPGITLLAHPLPMDDAERTGRVRDHMAVLAEGVSSRLRAMETARLQQAQASGIGVVLTTLGQTLDQISRIRAQQRLRASQIHEDNLKQLTQAFVHLGLTEGQEDTLTRIVQSAQVQLECLQDEESGIGDRLEGVVRQLQQLSGVTH